MYKRTPYGPGWALVGDAGYHLDPLAARGTTAAVASAELLSQAICHHLGGEQPEAEAFGRYHTARDELLAPEWDVTYGAIMRPARPSGMSTRRICWRAARTWWSSTSR